MGRSHALSGVLAGLILAPALGMDSAVAAAPFAVTTAGYALLPDLDHRSSSATRLLGPVTRTVSWGLRRASVWVYARTKGPRDEPTGQHRHLTHTLVFAVALGGVCAGTTALWGGWAALGWLVFGLLLAVDRLGRLALAAMGTGLGAGVVTAAATGHPVGPAVLDAVEATSGWLGLAVAVGCFVHCLGDSLTLAGCPWAFPVPIAGETWYELRPPRWLRFPAGGRVETLCVFPALLIGTTLAIPGLVPALFGTTATA